MLSGADIPGPGSATFASIGFPFFKKSDLFGMHGIGVSCDLGIPLSEISIEVTVRLKNIAGHPGLRGGSTPSVINQPNRYSKCLFQALPKVVTHCRKMRGYRGACVLPLALEIILRNLGANLWNRNHPDHRLIRERDFQITTIAITQSPFHVGLPRAEPNLSDHDVLKTQAVVGLHFQHVRTTGRHGAELDFPTTLGTGVSRVALAIDFDDDSLTGIRLAPYRIELVALQHHVVAKNIWHLDLC